MNLKTMKNLLAVLVYCLLRRHVLCDSPSESERYMTTISNFDSFAHLLSDKVILAGKKYFDKNLLVSMFLLLKEDNYLTFELMVKTNQKMNSFWTLLTNDNFHSKSKYDKTNPMAGVNKPDVYIMPIHERDKVSRLETQLEQLSEQDSFNPRAKFILLQLTNECG